jgi:CRISPR-associated protein Csb1
VPFARKEKSKDKGSPAEVNHGNIPPDILKSKDGEFIGGGVTFEYAEQTTVLSLAALRRLRFPIDGTSSADADLAARTVLAALALAAVAHQIDPPDYFLRSNCQLVLESAPKFQLVATAANVDEFTITATDADALFAEAVKEAEKHKLPWRTEPVVLKPRQALVDWVARSRELGGGEG